MMRKNGKWQAKKTLIAIRWCSHLILWRKFLNPIWGEEKKTQKEPHKRAFFKATKKLKV